MRWNEALRAALTGFLIILTVVVTLNAWVVTTVWIANQPLPPTRPTLKTSNLDSIASAAGVAEFTKAGWPAGLPVAPSLTRMDSRIVASLGNTRCAAVADPANPAFTAMFECTMQPSPVVQAECRFRWSLTPVFETGNTLATVKDRDDVVAKFPTSGYGKWAVSGPAAAVPYVGVAFVACANGRLPNPIPDWKLRVAFVLADAKDINDFHALFRTVGFDWVARYYFDEAYVAELFALASLYRVSRLVFTSQTSFSQTVTSSAQHDLFGVAAISAFRKLAWNDVHVGNVSGSQLGNSRGACLLVADVSGVASASVAVHVAPSGITPDLTTVDRSLVLLPTGSQPRSLPCTLVSAMISRNMPAKDYPSSLTGKTLRYYLVEKDSTLAAQRLGYAVRSAALTLYLLGFSVKYNPDVRTTHVSGSWPRKQFALGLTTP
jgi:hypothetical protein